MFIDAAILDLTDADTFLATAAAAERFDIATVSDDTFSAEVEEAAADAGVNDLRPAARAAWKVAARGWLDGSVAFSVASIAMTRALAGLVACRRCGGSGVRNEYHYVQNGRCFGCDGSGVVAA